MDATIGAFSADADKEFVIRQLAENKRRGIPTLPAQIFKIPRFILGILNLLAVGGNRTCLDGKAGGQKLNKFLSSKTKTQCA